MQLILLVWETFSEIGPVGIVISLLLTLILLQPAFALLLALYWHKTRRLAGTRQFKVAVFVSLTLFCMPLVLPMLVWNPVWTIVAMVTFSFFSGAIVYDCFRKLRLASNG